MNWLCIELHKSLNRLDFIVFNWILDHVRFRMMSWRKLSNILSWRGLQKARADLGDQGMSLELQWGGTWDRGTGQERDGIELRQIVWTSRLGRELLTLGQSHLSSSLFFVHFFLSCSWALFFILEEYDFQVKTRDTAAPSLSAST